MNLRYTSNFFDVCALAYNLFKSVENIVMTWSGCLNLSPNFIVYV